MEPISKHISWNEAVNSPTAIAKGIDNTPTPEHLKAMKLIAEKVFEPLRAHFGKPIKINSFYRSAALNRAIPGSSKTSQHLKGEAIDMDATAGFTNKDIFVYIAKNLVFDQLIWEAGTDSNPDWVHVSYKESGNRRQMLQMKRVNGKSTYISRQDLSFIK